MSDLVYTKSEFSVFIQTKEEKRYRSSSSYKLFTKTPKSVCPNQNKKRLKTRILYKKKIIRREKKFLFEKCHQQCN